MLTAVFSCVNHIVMVFTEKVNSQTDLSANFVKTITRRLQNAKTACKTVKSYGRYTIIIYRRNFYSATLVVSPGTASGGVTGSVVL